MLLAQLHVAGITNLDHLTLRLEDAAGAPRRLIVLFGGEGVGKTSLLAAVATTRPGHAVAQAVTAPASAGASSRADEPPLVAADWVLSDDDPSHDASPAPKVPVRPHPLRVVSPNAKLPGERDDAVLLRRREQALFDRRAAEGGFVLVAFSGARWFSRTPVLLTTPDRTVLRHDPRVAAPFDDATRADLSRDTKQVLAYAAISAALATSAPDSAHFEGGAAIGLDRALRETLAVLLDGTGAAYLGTSGRRLEPTFSLGEREVELDDLPRSLRHRIAFGTLTLRALAAAYPGRDPRGAEGVVLLDDLEVQQDGRALGDLPGLLRRALPRVQWIVTTASPLVAAGCDVSEVLALRRMPGSAHVELHQGPEAVVH